MLKYYFQAIEKENTYSIISLVIYYYKNNDYELMKKFCLMAINNSCVDSMIFLGIYYQRIEINYDLMIKYYLMVIEKNNISAMNSLALYYLDINNKNLAIKYFIKVIDTICKVSSKDYEYEHIEYYSVDYNKILEIQISDPLKLYEVLLKNKNEYDDNNTTKNLIYTKINELQLYECIKNIII